MPPPPPPPPSPLPAASEEETAETVAAVALDATSEAVEAAAADEAKDNLMQKVKDAGVAGLVSYVFWEWAFWGISIPVCVAGYREVTGHWPDLSNQDDVAKIGAEAFAFVNVARFAIPLRVGLALSTTPWVQANVVSRFQQAPSDDAAVEDDAGPKD